MQFATMPETDTVQAQNTVAPDDAAAPAGAARMFNDVLCAIDGKESGFTAVEHAAALAGTQGHLTVLAVTSFRSGGAHRGPAIGPITAAGILERAGAIARDSGLAFDGEVDPRSPPARVILDWSAQYDLLAIGAPAASWPARMLSVGVGNKALEGFTTPLLVSRPLQGGRRFGDRIVVASDGGESSHGLVELAMRLARVLGSNVTLVHALGRESPLKRGQSREQQRALEEQEQMLTGARAYGTNDVVVKPGRAADVIRAAAGAVDASLVLMGSRSVDAVRAMGRVTRSVVHQARCSVLLAPPETLAR
jgi:nucleotide-binding universal stress UspA family protein